MRHCGGRRLPEPQGQYGEQHQGHPVDDLGPLGAARWSPGRTMTGPDHDSRNSFNNIKRVNRTEEGLLQHLGGHFKVYLIQISGRWLSSQVPRRQKQLDKVIDTLGWEHEEGQWLKFSTEIPIFGEIQKTEVQYKNARIWKNLDDWSSVEIHKFLDKFRRLKFSTKMAQFGRIQQDWSSVQKYQFLDKFRRLKFSTKMPGFVGIQQD